ncbi:hypothetical protein JXA63_03370 [Candidatus Woesebacteria bacterium]|nr:hypothetical protein [Candidatus Woesebacteria bacterium]
MQFLEKRFGLDVSPDMLCDSSEALDRLYERYPDLRGDGTAIGYSDTVGRCQSWMDNPGWWKRLPEIESQIKSKKGKK